MNIKIFILLIFISAARSGTFAQNLVTVLEVPGSNEYCKIDPKGKSVLPSGRYVSPAGKTFPLSRGPFGLAIAPDENTAAVLHNGVVTIVPLNNPEKAIRIPPYESKEESPLGKSTFIGIAISQDGKTAYLSGGDRGNIIVFDLISLKKTREIHLDTIVGGKKYSDSFSSDLAIDYQLNLLLVLDRGNNRLVKIDLANDRVLSSIPAGRIPFGLAIDQTNHKAVLANVGFFEYPLMPGVTKTNNDSMNLRFPAYATHSPEMVIGITLPDGRKVPGLGQSDADEAMSVFIVDIESDKVVAKIKTGRQVGAFIDGKEIVGGASPNSIAIGGKRAYVSNATNDLISVIDLEKNCVIAEIPMSFSKQLDHFRGIMPFGLALSKDEKKLYVACLGLNAVAVIDLSKNKVSGYIPTGWGATRVRLLNNDKNMVIVSARGYGAGPNGGRNFLSPPQGTYIGDIQLGTIQILETPNGNQLKDYTRKVVENTFVSRQYPILVGHPMPPSQGLYKSPIKHIVYITKENRTYDEVYGKMEGSKGEPSLCKLGADVTVVKDKDTIKNVFVSPNHQKLARQFAFSDNFYCDSDASIHGHHWMVGTIPNEYVEANSSTTSTQMPFSEAVGRRFPKTTGGIDPEDYNEVGGLWENLERNGVSFYNFGECNEFANASEERTDSIFGSTNSVVFPFPKALYSKTSHSYAGFNMNIPDQFRAYQFEEEFTRKWLIGEDTMPQFLGIQLPNDHGASTRADDGFPYYESFMADNDLALGRIVHFLSRTKYWKNTLIIVTEDDPQGGVDHIDAHRSLLLMISPYCKRNLISHKHANFGSILRVIYNILDIPYVNHYDATASLLDDFFTPEPNTETYTVEDCDRRIFEPQQSLDFYKRYFNWRKIMQGAPMDEEHEQRKNHNKPH